MLSNNKHTTETQPSRTPKSNVTAPIVAATLVVALLLGSGAYGAFSFLGQKIFDANAASLEETYHEVAQTYAETSKARWNYLEQFAQYLELAEKQDLSSAAVKATFDSVGLGYTDFYLLSSNGTYVTLGGDSGYIDLGNSLMTLMTNRTNIVAEGSMPGRENMIFYAVPTKQSTFGGFTYYAVAFGYDRADISEGIIVAAYENRNYCYLAYKNGRIAFSLTDDDLHVNNVLTTLKDSGLSSEEIEAATQALANGETFTTRISRDGKTYYLSFQPAGFANNMLVTFTEESAVNTSLSEISNLVGFVVAALGVVILAMLVLWGLRAVRRRDAQLEEKDLVFSLISEDLDSIYILMRGSAHDILYVSPSVDRLLGIPAPMVMLNPHVLNRCSEDEALSQTAIDAFFDALKPGEIKREECTLTNIRTGKSAPYAYETYRPTGANSDMVMLVITDRTDEERVLQGVRDALEVARVASESKTNFLANMSHDIRTPMNAIIGFTGLILHDPNDGEKVKDYAQKIDASGQHLLSLINEVLDMSKIEAGKTELDISEFDMREFIENVISVTGAQARDKGLTFDERIEIADPKTYVFGDSTRLSQILFNILSNAIKYTEAPGTVTLAVSELKSAQEGFVSYKFMVSDTGIGMSPEYLQNIWTPFSREETEVKSIQGTGLGMAITKNLVDLMGGTINVKSVQGEGSTFTLWLEFKVSQKAAQDHDAIEAEAEEISLAGMHILAAEDNELNAELLQDLLSLEDASVDIATNGKEVVEKFEASEPGRYDFILMDVQMPVMNGYDATRTIRKSAHPQAQTIPIFAMTANAFTEDVAAAFESGVNAHLAKPIDMADFKVTIAHVLRGGEIDFDTR